MFAFTCLAYSGWQKKNEFYKSAGHEGMQHMERG